MSTVTFIDGSEVTLTGAEEAAFLADKQAQLDLFESEKLVADAKSVRDASYVAPITVAVSGGTKTFDLDEVSQNKLRSTIEEWSAVDLAAGGTGSIPWTLSDNTEVLVTLEDLKAVRQAGVLRGLQAHQTYQAIKNS